MAALRITLDQWAAFAVVEAGGYAKAAQKLHKSQSSVTYAVQQLARGIRCTVWGVSCRCGICGYTAIWWFGSRVRNAPRRHRWT